MATNKLLNLPANTVYELAREMKIVDHRSGVLGNWEPNYEQYKMWMTMHAHKYCYFLKVRQIGASTAILFDDVLWTSGNDALGQEVKCGVIIDTDEKAKEQLRRAEGFLNQMNIAYKTRGNNITFPNGSMMHFATAGGRRIGASVTFQRLHLTEVPFWRDATNAFNAIMQTLVLDGQCIIETTMGLDDPVGMNLWVDTNQYEKVFFPFEEHLEYRVEDEDDPNYYMSDKEESWLRSEGFTDTKSMRYWLWLLRNKSANDVHKNFREYPQTPEHSFKFAEGRWCNTDPEVLEPVEHYALPGIPGEIRIYRQPADSSHHVVVGVDTGGGLGRDNSAVAVVDGLDGMILATYVNSDVKTNELAQVAKSLQDRYTYHRQDGASIIHRVPPIRIEVNGIGYGTAHALMGLRCKLFEFSTSADYAQRCMEITSRKVTEGVAFGPADLNFEAKQIRTKGGQFLGFKDLFMTLGFCYDWLERNPYKALPQSKRTGVFDLRDRLKKGKKKARR